MAAEAEATRDAKGKKKISFNFLFSKSWKFLAKIVAAEGEQKSSRALREAANMIAQNPVALQLRYLQALSSVAADRNQTVVLPVPMDLIKRLISRTRAPSPPATEVL